MKLISRCLLLSLLFSCVLFPQTKEPLFPLRTQTPPVLDGILDDEVWQNAPMETGFMTYLPDYGSDMSSQTKVWYAYDRENIYFAFMCYDNEPDKIKTSIAARDNIRPDDWICINMDTFNDQQGLYCFYVNSRGIQMDSRAIGDEEDISADFVWYSYGRITKEGYAIEMRIPFKSIRYSRKDPVYMGVIFERYISRRTQAGTYPALDPKWGGTFNTQTRPLVYKDIKHYQLFELLPAFTYDRQSTAKENTLETGPADTEVSLTGKLGITSHLVLDGTLNPDFSQVEADAGQVDFNQRYALFYPEKRPFFLEGREHFLFGGHSGGDPLEAVVHTRTIVNPGGGIKLTGKIGRSNTVAAIYARDESPQQGGSVPQCTILRYKRALDRDSYVGGFFTSRETAGRYNRVEGTDGHVRLNRQSYLGFHAFLSQTQASDTAQHMDGHALGMNYIYNTRDWLMNIRLHDLSEDFNTETGFLTRNGITRFRSGIIRHVYTQSDFIKRIDPLLNIQFIRDKAAESWERSISLQTAFLLPRMSQVSAGYVYSNEIFLADRFSTSRIQVNGQTQFTKKLFAGIFFSHGKKIRYVENPYQGYGTDVTGTVVYQPSEKFNSSLSITYSDLYRDDTDQKIFDYTIIHSKNTFQVSRYLFFRAIVEYNSFYEQLMTDFLASFTYIPGTVIHAGYGSRYEKTQWNTDRYVAADNFMETRRGLFFKASYLWRL